MVFCHNAVTWLYSFILQVISSKLAELGEELAKATSDLEQEKATTLAQIEEIDSLKKVCNIIETETWEQISLLHDVVTLAMIFTVSHQCYQLWLFHCWCFWNFGVESLGIHVGKLRPIFKMVLLWFRKI